ncbi:MAG: hypothetical protein HDS52_05635 [Barnesiella sp.]|nr:hypothetical protein [Barnesiella sp.]
MKSFREYLNESSFENTWAEIVTCFSEPEELRGVYFNYYEKLKALPYSPCKGEISIVDYFPDSQPKGMNAAPDYLIDKKVITTVKNVSYITAVLLYWSSLHTFHTSKEHDDDLGRYLDIISSDNPRSLAEYLNESMKRTPQNEEIQKSIKRKEHLFWQGIIEKSSPGDWRGILYVLKRKLGYDMGFMRGFADHAGREHDADRMQLCCNLIDRATTHIYPDEDGKRALHLLFKVLEQNITDWNY